MARITVEDCLEKIPNRFQLVLAATYRARMLSQGHAPKIESKNKPGVTALREIAEGKIPLDDPDKTFAWMMNWSTVLERLQAPLYADVDTLVPRAVQRLLNPFRNHHATVEGILLEDPLDR
eukprot:gene17457-21350_t